MSGFVFAPSLLSADWADLKNAVNFAQEGGAGALHIDVMDGRFVPQISYGQPVVKSLRPLTKLPFDIHLMTEHPEDQVDSFAAAGADWITFHCEACVHSHRLIQHIKSLGKKAGVSLVPSTPVSALRELLEYVDIILVMTVNPGFGGQSIIPSCVRKITELKKLRGEIGADFKISVDGGVNSSTISSVIDAGADIIVSGSAFFSGELKPENIK
ncbi:MAG: ribulose-phosphate 3-epimerase [Treponema sp.]